MFRIKNGSKLQYKIETYSKALSQCHCKQAQNCPSLPLAQTGKPLKVTSKRTFTSLLFSSRFPSFPWNFILLPTVVVELYFASQEKVRCLTLELLTASLVKAHENMPGGTILHTVSQHSWELQTERDWWSQSPPSYRPSVRLFTPEGCLTQ